MRNKLLKREKVFERNLLNLGKKIQIKEEDKKINTVGQKTEL